MAVTQDISAELLLDAYTHGLFPWSEKPYRWYSPDPRAVFFTSRLKPPRRLCRTVRTQGLRVSLDQAFRAVMEACREQHRDTWIGETFPDAYGALHAEGYAHSVEVWRGEELVGGLYGVLVGRLFSGESMFHRITDASKVAFFFLAEWLQYIDVPMIDAQVLNAHTANLGAVLLSRADYLELASELTQEPRPPVRWQLPDEFRSALSAYPR